MRENPLKIMLHEAIKKKVNHLSSVIRIVELAH